MAREYSKNANHSAQLIWMLMELSFILITQTAYNNAAITNYKENLHKYFVLQHNTVQYND